MSKFKFSLQKVMQHRKNLEDIAQTQFLQGQAELHQQMQKLAELEKAKREARQQAFDQQAGGGKTSPALVQAFEFLKGQDIRIEKQKKVIQECESRVEKLREILRQKAIDYKIIEELRERKNRDFKEEQNKREQKQVDEMNVMRFCREENEK